jgi:hypothetical protein
MTNHEAFVGFDAHKETIAVRARLPYSIAKHIILP